MAPVSRVARSVVSSPPCNSEISPFPTSSTSSLPSTVTADDGSQCCQRRQRTEMTSHSSTTYSNSFKSSRRTSAEEPYPEGKRTTTDFAGDVDSNGDFTKSKETSRTIYEDISNSAFKKVTNSERQSNTGGLELLKRNLAGYGDSGEVSEGNGKTFKCEWSSGDTPGKIQLEKVEALRRDIEFAHDQDYVKVKMSLDGIPEEALSIRYVDYDVIVQGQVVKKEGESVSTQSFRRQFTFPPFVDMSTVTTSVSSRGELTFTVEKIDSNLTKENETKVVYEEVEDSCSQDALAESESNTSEQMRIDRSQLGSLEARENVSESSEDVWDPNGSTGSVIKVSASADSQSIVNSEEFEDEEIRCASAATEEESEGVFLTFDRIPIKNYEDKEIDDDFGSNDEEATFDEDFKKMIIKESGKVTVEDVPDEYLQDFMNRGIHKVLSAIPEEEITSNSRSSEEASVDQSTDSTEEGSVTYVAEAVLGKVNNTSEYDSGVPTSGNPKEYISEDVLGKVNDKAGYDLSTSISGNLKESFLENTQDSMNINLLESYMNDIIDIYMKKLDGQMVKNLSNVKIEYLENELTETCEDLDTSDDQRKLVKVTEKTETEDANCRAVENAHDIRQPIFESTDKRNLNGSYAKNTTASLIDKTETRSARYLEDHNMRGSPTPSRTSARSLMEEREDEGSGRCLSRSTSKKDNLFQSQDTYLLKDDTPTPHPISPLNKRERIIDIDFEEESDVLKRGSSRISILEGGSSTSSFPERGSSTSSVMEGYSPTSSVMEGCSPTSSVLEGGSSTSSMLDRGSSCGSIYKEHEHKEKNVTSARSSSKGSRHVDTETEPSSNVRTETSSRSRVHKVTREESSSDQSSSSKASSEPAIIREHPYCSYQEAVISEDENRYKVIVSVEDFKDGEIFLKAVGRHFMVEGRRLEKEDGKTVMYTFHRRLTMPSVIDAQRVTANLSKDGILCLLVPKGFSASAYDDRSYRTGINRRGDFMRSHSLDEETRNWRTLAASFFDDPFFDFPHRSSIQSKIDNFFNRDPFGHDYRRKFRSFDDHTREKRSQLSRRLDEMKSSSISDRKKKNLSSTKEDDRVYKIKVDLSGYGGQRCVNAVEGGLMVEADGKSGFGSRLRDPKFRKYFPVPESYNTKEAQAVLSRKGVLTISVPMIDRPEVGPSSVDTKTKASEERRRHSFSSAEGGVAEGHSREAGIIFSTPSPCPEPARQDSFGRDIRQGSRRASERIRKESGSFSEEEQTTTLQDSRKGEGLSLSVVPTDNEIQMILNVKDYKDGDLSVKTVGQTVVVEGRIEKKEEDSSVYTFRREFFLPSGMDMDSVTSAISPEGVLTITAQRKTNYRHSWHSRGSFDVM